MVTNKQNAGRGNSPNSRANLKQFRPMQSEKSTETVDDVVSVAAVENQALPVAKAGQRLGQGTPAAAELLLAVVSGKVRAPIHVRVQAAQTILGANGLLKQSSQQPPGSPVLPPAMVARLTAELERRRRAAESVQAEVIESPLQPLQ